MVGVKDEDERAYGGLEMYWIGFAGGMRGSSSHEVQDWRGFG